MWRTYTTYSLQQALPDKIVVFNSLEHMSLVSSNSGHGYITWEVFDQDTPHGVVRMALLKHTVF